MAGVSRISGLVVAALVARMALARAEEPPHVDFVVEEYWPARPSGAAPVIEMLAHDLMTTNGPPVLDSGRVVALLHYRRVPATTDPSVTSGQILDQYTTGKRKFQRGEDDAIKVLDGAEVLGQANGPATAQIENLQTFRIAAMLARALAHEKAGDHPGAIAAMTDLIRTFPDVPIVTPNYSSDAARLYAIAKPALDKLSPGIIHVDAPSCEIHINEVHRGTSQLDFVEAPGAYRVLVRCGADWSRYDVDVPEGQTIAVRVNPPLQRALVWGPQWFGLELAPTESAVELDRLHALAEWLSVKGLLGVVGLRQDADGTPYLVAKLYDPHTNTIVHQVGAELGTENSDPDQIAAISSFLSSDVALPNVVPLGNEPGPGRITHHSHHHHRHQAPNLALSIPLLAGGSLVGIAGGLMIGFGKPAGYGVDQYCCTSYPNLREVGIATLGLGVGMAGLGGYFFARNPHADRYWPAAVALAGAVALIPQGVWFIHWNNRGTCGVTGVSGVSSCPYLYGSGKVGWVETGAGVGAAAFAIGWSVYEWKFATKTPSRAPMTALVPMRGGAFASLSWTLP